MTFIIFFQASATLSRKNPKDVTFIFIFFYLVCNFLVPEVRLTRHYGDFKLSLWYQSVALVPRKCGDVSVLSQLHNFSSKTTKTTSPYALYRRPLAAGEHHSVPPGKLGESTYRPLPSYTKLSVSTFSMYFRLLSEST